MDEKCRLCLCSFDSDSIRISVKNDEFKEELETIFSFEIAVDLPNLPEYVCDECRNMVSQIHTYSLLVWNNQNRLLMETKESVAHSEEYIMDDVECDVHMIEEEIVSVESKDDELAETCTEFDHTSPEPVEVNDEESSKPAISDEEDTLAMQEDSLATCTEEETQEIPDQNSEHVVEEEIFILSDHNSEGSAEKDTLVIPERSPANSAEQNNLVDKKVNENRSVRCSPRKPQNPSATEKPKRKRTKRSENDEIIQKFFNLECELCSAPAENFGALLNHFRIEHNRKGYVRCCNKEFYYRSNLVDHIGAHKGLSRCEICQKSYKSKRYLAQHMTESHSQSDAKPFKCTQCHMSYSKEHLLRGHMQMHVKRTCQFCQKVLSNHHSLKVHISQVHSGDSHQICATCGKVFRTSQAMERHIKLVHQPQLVTWKQCDQCDTWFDCLQNLKKHIRVRHEQGGHYPCDKCSHVSINRRSLVYHKNRIHKNRKTYECEQCGKQLLSKLYLREHLATHSNAPLYLCDFCDVTFNSSANKYKHYKAKHFKEWEELKHQRQLEKMNLTAVPTDLSQK